MTHCSLGGQVSGEVLLGWFQNRLMMSVITWLRKHIRPMSNVVKKKFIHCTLLLLLVLNDESRHRFRHFDVSDDMLGPLVLGPFFHFHFQLAEYLQVITSLILASE